MQPDVLVIDFETTGLNVWESTCCVKSLAASWLDAGELKHWYSDDLETIGQFLIRLHKLQTPIIAHNIAFEMMVVKVNWPGLSLNWHADTARLTQNWDNGGGGDDKSARFGLEECIKRVLPKQYHNHKLKYHDWIKKNVYEEKTTIKHYKRPTPHTKEIVTRKLIKTNPGRYISQLPPDILEEYNLLDTELTLRLYVSLLERFKELEYDWKPDHGLYLDGCKYIIQAKIRGVKINRPLLTQSIQEIKDLIEKTTQKFKSQFPELILELELQQKTVFNINSTKQLRELFCDKLGKRATLFTPKMFPSFKTKHLSQWGKEAVPLMRLGTYRQALAAAEKLLEISETDGRWHQDLKTCGTRTGRYAGAGGLNVQGLSRRFEPLMRNFVADEGYIIVSSDLGSAEPSITAHYSKDANYRALTLDMVGKKPEWKNGLLYSDDIYISVMSATPMFADLIQNLLNKEYPAGDFYTQWITDKDEIVKYIKKERAVAKALVLGMSYGMGAAKLQKTALEAGFEITLKQAKDFHKAYWELFAGVNLFSKQCAAEVEANGQLINEFGYRNVCDGHKAFNALIQSTVSGVINLYMGLLFDAMPWAHFITVIHDELIYQVPLDKIEEARQIQQQITEKLNEMIDFSVKMRTGFVTGKTFYEAK